MKFLFFLMGFFCPLFIFGQDAKPVINPGATSYFDTIISRGEQCSVLHYHEVSEERKKQMIYSDGKDIFNDSFNKFSRLIILTNEKKIDLPTIPLENIIMLEDKEVIIGLTRIEISPYLVVIYNFKGELLYKGNLGNLVLKLKEERLKQLTVKYPKLLGCIDKNPCFKNGDTCVIEFSSCMIHAMGRDSARNEFKNKELFFGYYLPKTFSSDGGGIYKVDKSLYRYSDPLYNLVMIGSMPYLLTLNIENGKQVDIPLISNCELNEMFDKH